MRGAAIASLTLLIALAGMGIAQEKAKPEQAQPAVVLADLKPGEGWQELTIEPEEGIAARAWSDLADGCHLVSYRVAIPPTAEIDALTKSFAKTLGKADLTIADAQSADDGQWVSLAGEGLDGIANVFLSRQAPAQGSSTAGLQACYWNNREPDRCRAICQRVLGRVPSQGSL